MSQRDSLRSLDARIHKALAAVGVASDDAIYTPPGGGDPIPGVRVYLDEDGLAETGGWGTAANVQRVVTFLLEDCTPAKDGLVEVDGNTYKLVSVIERDASRSAWEVVNA